MRNGLIIDEFGTKRYFLNDELHRVDGPAEEWLDGEARWSINGKLHNETGHAIIFANGRKRWALFNKVFFTKKTWKEALNNC